MKRIQDRTCELIKSLSLERYIFLGIEDEVGQGAVSFLAPGHQSVPNAGAEDADQYSAN